MPATLDRGDYCRILGVPLSATKDDIRVAYRNLALRWHPDRHAHDKARANEKFIQIHEAYRILMTDTGNSRTFSKPSGHDGNHAPPSNFQKRPPTPHPSAHPTAYPSADPYGRGSSRPQRQDSYKPAPPPFTSNPPSAPFSARNPNTARAPPPPPPPSSQPGSRSYYAPPPNTNAKSNHHPEPVPRRPPDTQPPLYGHPPKPAEKGFPRDRYAEQMPYSKPAKFTTHAQNGLGSDTPVSVRLRKRRRPNLRFMDRFRRTAPKYNKLTGYDDSDSDDDDDFEYISMSLRASSAPRGSSRDWIFPLTLSLEELFAGAHLSFQITRHIRPPNSRRRGAWPPEDSVDDVVKVEFDVPPGCPTGYKVRCPGVGHECRDGTVQDIVFVIDEIPHERFRRVKDELYLDVTLPWRESLLREVGQLTVEGIDGKDYSVAIPYVRDRRTKGRCQIPGGGMPSRTGGQLTGRGNLNVRWEIAIMPNSHSRWNPLKFGMPFRR